MMSSNNQKNTPSGLIVLSGFLLLSIFGILYYAITVPSYIYLAIILIPLFIYMGLGIIKRWPGVRQTVMAVVMLLFIGAVVNLVAILFIEGAQEVTNAGGILRSIFRLAILPIVFFYLRSANVKSYFNQPPDKQINANTVQT